MSQEQSTRLGAGRYYRHARRRRRVLIGTALACACGLVGGVAVVVVATDSPAACAGGTEAIEVVVAPELAPVVAEVARTAPSTTQDPCWRADVVATDPAAALDGLAAAGPLPAVWIPDASTWLRPSATGDLEVPDETPSVAQSPIVLATSEALAGQVAPRGRAVDLRTVLLGPPGQAPELGLPDPARSAASMGVLLHLAAETAGDPAGRLDTARILRAARGELPTAPLEAVSEAADDGRLAVPVSEQALWEHGSRDPSTRAGALHLPGTAPVLDYPYVVLAADPAARAAADRLLEALRADAARDLLDARGLRPPDGRAGAALARDPGVAAVSVTGAATGTRMTSDQDADAALRTYEALTRDSRVLTVIDVSGSMRETVPGAGGATRMDLVREAAAEGLNVFPDAAHIGLWEFATDLAPGRDYREVVPVGPLTERGGRTGRQELARALRTLDATDGDTGLYDSTLAAVRSLRATFDPDRANVVVVLSDGRNEDERGLDLDELLTTLRKENDPGSPVPVVTVAYGPDTDAAAMAAISEATGGLVYRSPDPLRVGEVFLDAIARRPCLPAC